MRGPLGRGDAHSLLGTLVEKETAGTGFGPGWAGRRRPLKLAASKASGPGDPGSEQHPSSPRMSVLPRGSRVSIQQVFLSAKMGPSLP